jgi:drug/metabolite transporter (DMT)-like permease
MIEPQASAKKNHTAGNVAGIGAALGLLGAFLIWRGNNLDSPSTVGFLLVLVALAFLLTALLYRYKR